MTSIMEIYEGKSCACLHLDETFYQIPSVERVTQPGSKSELDKFSVQQSHVGVQI